MFETLFKVIAPYFVKAEKCFLQSLGWSPEKLMHYPPHPHPPSGVGIGLSIGVYIYSKVFLRAYIF